VTLAQLHNQVRRGILQCEPLTTPDGDEVNVFFEVEDAKRGDVQIVAVCVAGTGEQLDADDEYIADKIANLVADMYADAH